MRWKNPLVGRIRPESLAGYYRIEWPDVARTGGRMLQEYANIMRIPEITTDWTLISGKSR